MSEIKNPVTFIFITVLVDCIGVGIIFPVVATIVTEVSHVSVNRAIVYSGWMMTAYALMQFIFSPTLGGISDKYGRRPVLLLSLLGLGIDYIFLTVANTLPLLFIGRIIAGICGASFTTAFAYIADVSPPEKRAQNFGMMGAAFGVGFIIGPVIGGIASHWGTRAPFVVAACLSLINWLYGYFVLPESLKPENRRNFDWRRANPLGAFIQIRKNRNIRVLVLAMFLIYLAGQVMPAIWAFYTKYQYAWSDLQIGYSLAFVGMMVAIVQGGLIKWSQTKLGGHKSVYVGLIFYLTGLILFASANQSWMMYAYTFIYALGGIAPPSIQGIISSHIPPTEQGELQGMMTALMSVSTILSPLIMTNLFYQFTKESAPFHFPGAAFTAAALLVFIAIFVARRGLMRIEGKV